jgi:hypothetical protein
MPMQILNTHRSLDFHMKLINSDKRSPESCSRLPCRCSQRHSLNFGSRVPLPTCSRSQDPCLPTGRSGWFLLSPPVSAVADPKVPVCDLHTAILTRHAACSRYCVYLAPTHEILVFQIAIRNLGKFDFRECHAFLKARASIMRFSNLSPLASIPHFILIP